MPFLGNTPSTSFATVTKDAFSGDGSTVAFTLSKVATTNSVSVFVENVRQEPTTAYAVSGTTLTFTAAPVTSSGNNIYVLHMLPTSTATHPAAQNLTAVDGTFTGAFTSLGIDDNANATSITIDSAENVGILNTSPSSYGNAHELVVGNHSIDDAGITIATTTGSSARIQFADNTDSPFIGAIEYYHASTNAMMFYTNANTKFTLADTGSTHVLTNANNTYVSRTNNTVGSGNVFMHLWRMTIAPDDNTSTFLYADDGDGSTNRIRIDSDGDVKNHDNSYGSTSDERIKQDITDANSQWDDIKAVKVRNFKKKDDVRQYGDKAWSQIGVIAQELETVSPKLIRENSVSVGDILSSDEFGTLEDDLDNPKSYYEDGDTIPNGKKVGDAKEYHKKVKEQKTTVKSVNYSILYMKAVKALQEAMTRIETLESKVKALEDA